MFDSPSALPQVLPLQQHQNFAAALTAYGQPPLILNEPDTLLVIRRRFAGSVPLAMISRGPVGNDGLEQIKNALGSTPVILSPDSRCEMLPRSGAVPLMTPATLAEIDLTLSESQRHARLYPKWRNRLTKAQNSSLRVSHGSMPVDPGHWLLRAEALQQSRRGYRGWPTALTLAYAMENKAQTHLFTAYLRGHPVAAMLFLLHGDGATYHIGHTDDDGRRLSAHTLLLWSAVDWLAQKGHTRLDLGLLDTRNAPGLARFKLGSGATLRRLGGTWLYWSVARRFLAPLAALDQRRM